MAQIDHPGFIKYRPTKIVAAMRISSIRRPVTTANDSDPKRPGYIVSDKAENVTFISEEFFDRHEPCSGGYLVLLSNEKLSFLSRPAFLDLVKI